MSDAIPIGGLSRMTQTCHPPQTMMPIPAKVTATPARSQAVGDTPSMRHSHNKATAT